MKNWVFIFFLLRSRPLLLLPLTAKADLLGITWYHAPLRDNKHLPLPLFHDTSASFLFSGGPFAPGGKSSLGLKRVQDNSGGLHSSVSFLLLRSLKAEFRKCGSRCPGQQHSHRIMQLLHVCRILEVSWESRVRSQALSTIARRRSQETPTLLRWGEVTGPLCLLLCCHHVACTPYFLPF